MTILFDFGGTLDADGVRWSVRYYRAFRDAGGALPFSEFEPLFHESDHQLERIPGITHMGFQRAVETQSALVAALLAQVGESIDPASLTRPVHAQAVAIAARNRPTLDGLAAEHRLGVVSNFTGNLRWCLAELDLAAPFEVVIDSGVFGAAKPDPRIFQRALTDLDADPRATWMVGDNPEMDIAPANALGLKTCWIAPPDARWILPGAPAPSARIAQLIALPSVLEAPCTA